MIEKSFRTIILLTRISIKSILNWNGCTQKMLFPQNNWSDESIKRFISARIENQTRNSFVQASASNGKHILSLAKCLKYFFYSGSVLLFYIPLIFVLLISCCSHNSVINTTNFFVFLNKETYGFKLKNTTRINICIVIVEEWLD